MKEEKLLPDIFDYYQKSPNNLGDVNIENLEELVDRLISITGLTEESVNIFLKNYLHELRIALLKHEAVEFTDLGVLKPKTINGKMYFITFKPESKFKKDIKNG